MATYRVDEETVVEIAKRNSRRLDDAVVKGGCETVGHPYVEVGVVDVCLRCLVRIGCCDGEDARDSFCSTHHTT